MSPTKASLSTTASKAPQISTSTTAICFHLLSRIPNRYILANLASPKPSALPLPLFIHLFNTPMEEDSAPSTQLLHTTPVTHLCISPSGSLLDPSRVYHLTHKVRPEPSHLFHVHYCHARPSCPQLIPPLAAYTHMNKVPCFRCSLCPFSSTEAERDRELYKPPCNLQTPFPTHFLKHNPHLFCSSEMLKQGKKVLSPRSYMIHPMNPAQMSSFLSGTHYSVFCPEGLYPTLLGLVQVSS